MREELRGKLSTPKAKSRKCRDNAKGTISEEEIMKVLKVQNKNGNFMPCLNTSEAIMAAAKFNKISPAAVWRRLTKGSAVAFGESWYEYLVLFEEGFDWILAGIIAQENGVKDRSYSTLRYGPVGDYEGECIVTLPDGDKWRAVGFGPRGTADTLCQRGGIRFYPINRLAKKFLRLSKAEEYID